MIHITKNKRYIHSQLNRLSSGIYSKGSKDLLGNPAMQSRDILRKAKGNHLDQVHSDQKVLEMIGVVG
jgi:hypothetical protein